MIGRNTVNNGDRVFVVSDIHGQLAAFEDCLKKAKFVAGRDTLYCLGDMIDWGTKGVEVVKKLMLWQQQYPDKVFVTLGNHEHMCLSAMLNNSVMAMATWEHNRGAATVKGFERIQRAELQNILCWLNSLPIAFERDNFYLTHSAPLDRLVLESHVCSMPVAGRTMEELSALWVRVEVYKLPQYAIIKAGKTLVSGHTVTPKYHADRSKCKVYKCTNYINIDCAAKAIDQEMGAVCLYELYSGKTYYSSKRNT